MCSHPECQYSDFQLQYLSALTYLCEQTLLSQISASFPVLSSSGTDIGSMPRWVEKKSYLNKKIMKNDIVMKKSSYFCSFSQSQQPHKQQIKKILFFLLELYSLPAGGSK